MVQNRLVLFLIFALMAVSAPQPAHAGQGGPATPSRQPIRSASELDYPPFSILNTDGSADGFSVDLLKAVAGVVGLDIQFRVGVWNDIKTDLIEGRLDALPLVSYSKARDEVMDFSAPYLRMHGAIFVRQGNRAIQREADLKDKEVLVMKGDTAHEYALRNDLSRKLVLTDSFEDAFRKLSEGQHDAIIIQHLVGLQLMKRLGIRNVVSVASFDETSLKPAARPLSGFEQRFCFAVREGDKDLLAKLNEGLSLVIADGVYDALYDKWFGPILPKAPVDAQTLFKYVSLLLLPILTVVWLAGFWYLRREVASKTRSLERQVEVTRAAKEALTLSEARMRALINTLPDLIWLKDPEGVYLSCNERFERFFGAVEQDIVGKTDYDFVGRAMADSFKSNDQAAMAAGGPHRNEEDVVFADDGHREILETIKTPMFGANGDIVGVLGIGRDITERKLAEAALKKSEEKFRLTFDSSPDAININRLQDGQYIEINDGFTQLTGFTREDVTGRTSAEIDIWHDPRDRAKLIAALDADGVCDNLEATFRKKDGTLATGLMSARTIDLNGSPHIISITRDISDRKRYESEREITLHLLQSLQRKNDLRSLIRDITRLMQNWSGCEAVGVRLQDGDDFPYYATHGFSRAFVADEKFLCAVDRDGNPLRDASGNPVLECMCGNVVRGRFDPSLPFFTANGSFWTNSTTALMATINDVDRKAQTRNRCHGEGYESVALVPLKSGSQTLGLLQFNDKRKNQFDAQKIALFERLAASLALGLSQRITALALRESEVKYRSMMEAMQDAAYICSSDFRVEYMNPAMIQWIGRDATGEWCHEVLHGTDRPCPQCVLERVIQGDSVSSEVEFSETNKTYHVSNSPVFHTDGSVSKLTIFRDMTEIKSMEKRIQQAQKMESIGVLAGGIAHDFNNILFPIVGLSELLLEDLPADGEEHKNVFQIYQSAMRARDLVNQILSFSKQIEQKKFPLKIQQVLKEVVKLMRATIPSNIKITQRIESDCGPVLADPTQIHQIAMNLVTNAYHAVEDRGGEITIQLEKTVVEEKDLRGSDLKPGDYAVMSVADTGHGIAPELIDRIFDPYFTTKTQGKGTGLGLSIVYGLVVDHGGTIEVDSKIDVGSTISVILPLINPVDEKKPPQDDARLYETGNERILVVDDEAVIAKFEKQMLERLGYDVEVRTSSIEALSAFKAKPQAFDLVITDMTMPNMTGDKLASALLAIRPDLPVIICTGFSERINSQKAAALGAKGLLLKPVPKSDLAAMVRSVLDESKRPGAGN